MDADKHYESVRFYILEAGKTKEELAKHETEYNPEKVRTLIASYKYTLQKIIEEGEIYLSLDDNDREKANKVFKAIDAYKKLLNSIK